MENTEPPVPQQPATPITNRMLTVKELEETQGIDLPYVEHPSHKLLSNLFEDFNTIFSPKK